MIIVDGNKEQHFNSSCASVCIAILLSNQGVEKEDYDVIQESYMAFLLKYDKHSNMIAAGLKMQTPDVFNLMLCKYNLLYKVKRCSNWADFKATADVLLKQGIPFMVGLKPDYLFEETRNADDSKHAIVVYKKERGHYCVVNPSKRENRKKVVTHLSVARMGSAINRLGDFKVGFILKTRNNCKTERIRLFRNSRDAFDIFQKKMDMLDRLIGEKKIDEEKYMDYIHKFIKPIALDLLTAVEASQNKSITQKSLEMKLRDFQLFALKIQRTIKKNERINMAENTFHGYAKEIRLLFNKHIVEREYAV